jgi:NADPH:quinone reductase-like Zn-dependent oxidoreductase
VRAGKSALPQPLPLILGSDLSGVVEMVFDHGRVNGTKRVLVQGAAGNVGGYAVQLAKRAGAKNQRYCVRPRPGLRPDPARRSVNEDARYTALLTRREKKSAAF